MVWTYCGSASSSIGGLAASSWTASASIGGLAASSWMASSSIGGINLNLVPPQNARWRSDLFTKSSWLLVPQEFPLLIFIESLKIHPLIPDLRKVCLRGAVANEEYQWRGCSYEWSAALERLHFAAAHAQARTLPVLLNSAVGGSSQGREVEVVYVRLLKFSSPCQFVCKITRFLRSLPLQGWIGNCKKRPFRNE